MTLVGIFNETFIVNNNEDKNENTIESLDRILSLEPDNEAIREQRFKAYIKLGNYAAAIDDINHLLKLNPNSLKLIANLALLKFSLNKFEEALPLFTQIINAEPDNLIALRHRKIINEILRQKKQAEDDFEKIKILERPDTKWDSYFKNKYIISGIFIKLSNIEKNNRNFGVAQIYCTEGYELLPGWDHSARLRTKLLSTNIFDMKEDAFIPRILENQQKFIKGDYKSAIKGFTSIIKTHIGDDIPAACANRALAQSLSGNYNDARKDLDKALNHRPNDPYLLNSRALLFRIMGQDENAERDIEIARQNETLDVEKARDQSTSRYTDEIKKLLSKVYVACATIEFKKGKYKAASVYCDEACRLQGNDPDVQRCHTEIQNTLANLPLIKAIKENNQEDFFRIVQEQPLCIHELDKESQLDALCWAATLGHAHFITPLVKAGADINKENPWGRRAATIAAEKGYLEVLTALIAEGLDIDKPNQYGNTLMLDAAEMGQDEMIRALKALGAKTIDTPNSVNTTPMYMAVRNGHAKAIAALKEAGATTLDTPSGDTPMFATACAGDAEAITKQRKIISILEELKTFFLEERVKGKISKQYELYNTCLKQVHPTARLVYKHIQEKHVLYINDKPFLDTDDAAAQEISKMLESLVATSQPTSFSQSSNNYSPSMFLPSSSKAPHTVSATVFAVESKSV